jgi:Fanconi anemia group M protein
MLEAQKYVEHPLVWPNTVEFRLYQKRIAEVAFEKNTLVVLPTALGKTVISALVAAELLYNYRDSKILVMAPTRPLIMQHRNSFMKLLKLREKDVCLLTGKTPPQYRSSIWAGEARVMFSTPQVVRNDLLGRRLSLADYGLLVFDECHRAVRNYAYTDIAKHYVSQAKYPMMLGMTASPGSQRERVREVCSNLYIETVEYRSEEDPDVKQYVNPIEIEWKTVDLPSEYNEVRLHIKAMLDRRVNWLFNKGLLKANPRYVTRRSLIEAGDTLRYMLEESIEEERGRIFTAIINQSLALTVFHMLDLLETQGIPTLKVFLDKVEHERREKKSYAILTYDPAYRTARNLLEKNPMKHPKTELLTQTVQSQLQAKPSSRTLIFTQYRDTASILVQELSNIQGVRAERFVGQASKPGDKGLSQEEQAERLTMLEEGALNVLVATSIAEEGLDIPAVDHVIFYEPIPSEIRYIQRRGRTGRKAPGKVTILAAKESLDMIYLYASRRRTEKMRKIARNINLNLRPILRTKPRPKPNPLTKAELATIEQEARRFAKVKPETVKPESEVVRDLARKVEHLKRIAYMKLLERGMAGATVNQLFSDIEIVESTSIPILQSTIKKMINDGLVTETSTGKYAASSAIKAAGKKTYDVTVDTILRGKAIVSIDDKWKARLKPEEYNGPEQLMKKNSKFKAAADLYRENGVLCIRINEVTEVL